MFQGWICCGQDSENEIWFSVWNYFVPSHDSIVLQMNPAILKTKKNKTKKKQKQKTKSKKKTKKKNNNKKADKQPTKQKEK